MAHHRSGSLQKHGEVAHHRPDTMRQVFDAPASGPQRPYLGGAFSGQAPLVERQRDPDRGAARLRSGQGVQRGSAELSGTASEMASAWRQADCHCRSGTKESGSATAPYPPPPYTAA